MYAILRVIRPVLDWTLLLVVLQITVILLIAAQSLSGLLMLNVFVFFILAQDVILIVDQVLHPQLVVVEMFGGFSTNFTLRVLRFVDFDVARIFFFFTNVFAPSLWLVLFATRRKLVTFDLAIQVTDVRLFSIRVTGRLSHLMLEFALSLGLAST